MKAVVLGGSKGMGRALARQLVEQGAKVFLLGRDLEDLARSAADLEQRGGGVNNVSFAECDLADVEQFESALAQAETALGGLDTVVVTAGLFGTQEQLESDPALTHWMLDLNFTKTILFCEVVRKRLLSLGGGTLVVFSSVAGERARKPVVLYGAAKAGLSAYLEGLDHKYRGEGLKTICVKPGFVKTSMTEGLPAPPFAGTPEQVASQVARAMRKGTPVVYTPSIWALVMLVIRHLPRFVMRRIGF